MTFHGTRRRPFGRATPSPWEAATSRWIRREPRFAWGRNSTIVYRRSRVEMPARAEEVHHGEQEGVVFHLLTAPTRILSDANNRVTGMECLKMELGEPDASGRRRPVPIKGSEFVIPADTVIVSIGNMPNPLVPQTSADIEVSRHGTIVADPETMATSKPGVFAGGDIVSGAATVISAMGQAKISRPFDSQVHDGRRRASGTASHPFLESPER